MISVSDGMSMDVGVIIFSSCSNIALNMDGVITKDGGERVTI